MKVSLEPQGGLGGRIAAAGAVIAAATLLFGSCTVRGTGSGTGCQFSELDTAQIGESMASAASIRLETRSKTATERHITCSAPPDDVFTRPEPGALQNAILGGNCGSADLQRGAGGEGVDAGSAGGREVEEPCGCPKNFTVSQDDEGAGIEMTYLGTWQVYGYDTCAECCGWSAGITTSGAVATVGRTCASNDFPLGTVLYIEGIGYRTVEDRGGMARGVIDVLCADHPACYAVTGWYDVYIVREMG